MNIKLDNGIKPPKQRKKDAIPKAVRKAFDEYKVQYKKLYGVTPLEPTYEDGYIKVEGAAGVSLKIFRQRISKLRYRNS